MSSASRPTPCDIANLRQTNYATTAGVFKLPGLKLSFSDKGC